MENDACDLRGRRCGPCNKSTPTLDVERADELHQLVPDWAMDQGRLQREFAFRDFATALMFVNRVGDLAEAEGHHPDILLHRWKHVTLMLTTHAIGGLSENDFIVAAKIDAML